MQAATQQTTRESESAIIEKNDRLIRYLARPFAHRNLDLDDLMQEGRIALLGAARSFSPEHGASLWTYARKFVLGAFLRMASEEAERARRERSGDDSDNATDCVSCTDPSPEETLAIRELFALVFTELGQLTAYERHVLGLYFSGDRGVASALGLPGASANRLVKQTIEKLRDRVGAKL